METLLNRTSQTTKTINLSEMWQNFSPIKFVLVLRQFSLLLDALFVFFFLVVCSKSHYQKEHDIFYIVLVEINNFIIPHIDRPNLLEHLHFFFLLKNVVDQYILLTCYQIPIKIDQS